MIRKHDSRHAGNRRHGRIVAMQRLYEQAATGGRSAEAEGEPDALAYSDALVRGVVEHQESIDRRIAKVAPQWPLDEIAAVDLAVLRVAVYELFVATGVPVRVAIDEAVEIAKEYGGEGSGRFVNGVLGRLQSEHESRG